MQLTASLFEFLTARQTAQGCTQTFHNVQSPHVIPPPQILRAHSHVAFAGNRDEFFRQACSMMWRNRQTWCKAFGNDAAPDPSNETVITLRDLELLRRAAQLAQTSCGETQPHPNAACILTDASATVVAEASLWAQGTEPPEVAATRSADGAACSGTAYLNLESGDCPGDAAGVRALLASGVSRVIIGLRHPIRSQRGVAITALRQAGITVNVLGEASCAAPREEVDATLDEVVLANEALLHRAGLGRPLGILKYAMTLDGKIAASSGHSAWVSSPQSRQIVFDTRARCDAVIVGGQTVRRDNPRLTTRRDQGHQPIRVVMSRTLDLPADAALWDISHAPTIVATQRGARQDFQRVLRSRGVEVLEFDFLTPDAVAEHCHARGFLSLLWECGGTLAAPAIAGGAIHKTLAFIAPKIIGGTRAPTPVGDLGFVEMTQAVPVSHVTWRQVGPDVMMSGYLPRSQGPRALAALLDRRNAPAVAIGHTTTGRDGVGQRGRSKHLSGSAGAPRVLEFYKSWDKYGALSNFTPHAVAMPPGPMTYDRLMSFRPHMKAHQADRKIERNSDGAEALPKGWRSWPSVEHYYQAQKFAGVDHREAIALVEKIASASSPETAAALGRRGERTRPDLLRDDWSRSKIAAMHAGLRVKFATHAGPRELLLSTAAGGDLAGHIDIGAVVVEAAPHDYFWGRGVDGNGQNMLGKLLMTIREELMEASEGGDKALLTPSSPPQPAGRR
jgi:diaminohydroxyphosphoribosylaminopyrimidine deaminase / 5-amino-6-(5-phosphoribosylamino)uracil reductase